MGRAHEVRAASMAATNAKKTALYMRASKEIYMAARSGEPDPNANLALRAAIEKFRGQNIPKDVIQRAIEKLKAVPLNPTLLEDTKVMDQAMLLLSLTPSPITLIVPMLKSVLSLTKEVAI